MKLRIEIEPIPCPRPRVRAIKLRTSGKTIASAYYPAAYAQWKAKFAELVDGPDEPLDGPLSLTIRNFVKKPRTSKLDHPVGDVDNYAKSVMDALTQLGFWHDDKQVISLLVTKEFTSDEALVCIEINQWQPTRS